MTRPRTVHAVTGATGLLGGALCLRLLDDDPSCRLVCLARGRGEGARARVLRHLTACARAYGMPDLAAAIPFRVSARPWDMDNLSPVDLGGVQTVWHLAAVRGARNDTTSRLRHTAALKDLLAAAVAVRVQRFVYASTAFVGDPPRNDYERAKAEGEQLVSALHGPQWRILRPVMVMGHSRTGAALTPVYGGLYALARGGPWPDGEVVPTTWNIDAVAVDVAARQAVEGSGEVTWLNSPNRLEAASAALAACNPDALARTASTVRGALLAACPYLPSQVRVPLGDGDPLALRHVRAWRDWYTDNVVRGTGVESPTGRPWI